MKRLLLAVTAAACAWGASPRAMQRDLDVRAIQEAIAIGQSRLTGERDRFHLPYRLLVQHPPVDYIDVVTPFRRVVLAAQARAEAGDRSYGQREALETIAASPDVVDLYVELTFHPLNTYLGVPDYRITLMPAGAAAPRIDPESIERIPRYGPRVNGLPLPLPRPGGALPVIKGSQPMLGGTAIAHYDARMLDANGRYEIVISEEGKELARARADFGGLR